jgi:hypothetical protein
MALPPAAVVTLRLTVPDVHDKYLALVLHEADIKVRVETKARGERERRRRREARLRVAAERRGTTERSNPGTADGYVPKWHGRPPS